MTLSARHKDSIDRYLELVRARPDLFSADRVLRPITQRNRLEAFSVRTGEAVGLLVESPYLMLLNDLVETTSRDVDAFTYLRVLSPGQLNGGSAVVVVAQMANSAIAEEGAIAVVRHYRHALGRAVWELPRGFAEPHTPGMIQAEKELREETGLYGDEPELLGETYTDSGISDSRVAFYRIRVTGRVNGVRTDPTEPIESVRFVTQSQFRGEILRGEITDGFAVQALAFLRHGGGSDG